MSGKFCTHSHNGQLSSAVLYPCSHSFEQKKLSIHDVIRSGVVSACVVVLRIDDVTVAVDVTCGVLVASIAPDVVFSALFIGVCLLFK